MSAANRLNPSIRAVQAFVATTSKTPVRRLHVTGATYQPSQLLKPFTAQEMLHKPKRVSYGRSFNTTRALKAPNDASTVDFAFLPSISFDVVTSQAFQVPILPDNYRDASKTAERIVPVPIATPEISTASMATEGQLSVLGESHDSGKHAEQMDVFGLVEGVGTKVKEEVEAEVGVLRQVFNDLMDDILGKKAAKS